MNTNKLTQSTCFFGNRGVFSATVFNHLIQKQVSISQVFCASSAPALTPEKSLPVSQPIKEERLDSLAHLHNIPVDYLENQKGLNSIDLHQLTKPDFVLVACFPFRLPNFLIQWPKLGCLNIHPSLLPQYRGPDPLFWQLFNGEEQTGVSLHLMTSNIDAGPVITRKKHLLNDGATRNDIETSLAEFGAELFTTLLSRNITQNINGTRQDEEFSSYYPGPTNSDYEISQDWSAKHAYNFIRGTCSPTEQYQINTGGKDIKILSTTGYTNDGKISGDEERANDEILIQLSPGILRVKQV